MDGYTGKVMLVNLSNRSANALPIDREDTKRYIGGRGLGIKYLCDYKYQDRDQDNDPLSPGNPLIFMTGPYTATRGISSGFFNITTKSPLTNMACSSHSGGYFGPALKRSGFDGIVLEGKSEEPVYLLIDNGNLIFNSASEIWGEDVYRTTEYLERKHVGVRVATIGPAGEKKIRFAAIMNDRHRAAARGGVGAVMGSKNLKAIAVKGALPFTVADEKMIEDLAEIGNKRIRAKKLMMTEYGTAGSLLYWNMIGALATENHRRRNFSTAEEISGEEMARRFKVKNHGCYRCPIACAQIVKMENEKHEIETSTGPELETLISLGSKCGIHDLEVIIKANDLCNRMGLDTISTGATIAMAMEMNELGIINDSTTGGMDVCFGNAMILLDLIEMISYRRGFGDLLAEGSFLASIKLGAPDLALGVNGMEIPGVDPRATFGMGLSYVTSNRGACHLRSMLYVEEVFEAKLNRFSVKGKAEELKYKEDLMAVLDSVLMCKFAQRHAGYELIDLTNLLRGITGIEFTVDNLLEVGDRIYTLERLYNTKQRKLDTLLPDRFYEESLPDGSDKVKTIDREEFINEILRYYQIRGWNRDGNPSSEKLQQLGISYSQKTY